MSSLTVQQAFDLAQAQHRAGQLGPAEQLYRQILAVQPAHGPALHGLGILAHQAGNPALAAELFAQAAQHGRGGAVAEAYSNLGGILEELGRYDEAIAACGRAIAMDPNMGAAHCNLGNALRGKGEADAAIAAYQRALALQPGLVGAHVGLGGVFYARGQLDEAIAAFRAAVALRPNHPGFLRNLGDALRDKGELEAAVATYRQVLELNKGWGDVYGSMVLALMGLGRLDEAHLWLQQSLAINPRDAGAMGQVGCLYKMQGMMPEAIDWQRRTVALAPGFSEARSNLIVSMLYGGDDSAAALAAEHRAWNEQHALPLATEQQPHGNERLAERRLRVGFVSPCFRDHVIGRNMLPLFRHLDRAAFDVFCYSDTHSPDARTAEFRQHADTFRETARLNPAELAAQIRSDRIDILLDLTLHLSHNRLLTFARRPAPVQATFAGYPGTTGLTAIDYRLSDPYLDPPGEAAWQGCYSEKTLHLPASWWCYDPLGDVPDGGGVGPLPARAAGHVTFGCLNNFCKVTAPMLALWARVLVAVPGSQLVLLAFDGAHRQRTLGVLEAHGVAPSRVSFVQPGPRQEYLRTFQRIDISLDTLPYNGHTTSLDSLYMGVPVVTLVGDSVVGRAGLSQLTNLGLTELVAHDAEEFVAIAVDLAKDLPRLAALRAGLRVRMEASPLMDARGFTRGFEAALRTMWHAWRK